MTNESMTVGSICVEVRKIEKDTRQILIESAQKLMAANGYHNTKVEEITKESGVAKGTFYNYFTSKEEMLFEMVKEKEQEFRNIAENLEYKENNFENNMKKMIKSNLIFAVNNQEFFMIITKVIGAGDTNLNKKLKDKFHHGRKEKLENIEKAIEEGIKNKEIPEEIRERLEDYSNIFSAAIDSHSFSLIFKNKEIFHSDCDAEKKDTTDIDIDAEVEFIYNFFRKVIQK